MGLTCPSDTRTSTCTGKFRAPMSAFTRSSQEANIVEVSRTMEALVTYMRSEVSSGEVKSWRSTLRMCARPVSSKYASSAYSVPSR